ncbi:class I SAM-dependent methyltransferase [Paenibacillus sp. 1011MAR3C5]|uniref:class I SAM-dependent methyltransferase n=1 Tax=Paenibacillus sp. 1011MAR3C5 TaxID=1675787 RepID=UPI00160269A4|nr:class I SAM-dependent methyltransferase [Paenibacillus sp. 1011MAR3C5]
MSKSERFWDKTASKYDQIEMKDAQTYQNVINRTKKYLKSCDIVMDFGCGTGIIANEIAEDVQELHAIDISANMIEIAGKKAYDRSIANISYVHTTIFDERYKEGSFDAILAFHILHLLENEQVVLQRINELLKPGALLISATPCMGEKRILKGLLSVAGKVGLMPAIQAFKINDLVDAFKRGGFSIVETDCLNPRSQEYFIVARKN